MDKRKHPIRGSMDRNGRYYAQLTVELENEPLGIRMAALFGKFTDICPRIMPTFRVNEFVLARK